MSDLLVWWTSQKECEVIGGQLVRGTPLYMRLEYSRRVKHQGDRNKGNLWFSERLLNERGKPVSDALDAINLGFQLTELSFLAQFIVGNCEGILIDAGDAWILRHLPGIITTPELERAYL